jgi:hypothetical protein
MEWREFRTKIIIVSVLIGLIMTIMIGNINAIYSRRYNYEMGLSSLREFIEVGISNPYAVITGILASMTSWRYGLLLYGNEEKYDDSLLIGSSLSMAILAELLFLGIIVY